MTLLKLLAIALMMITLSACVGFVVPIPLSSSTTSQETEHNERR